MDELEEEESRGTGSGPLVVQGSGVRTFFIFTEFPSHVEHRVADMPLLPEGTTIHLSMSVRDPRTGQVVAVQGPHEVASRKLVFNTTRQSLMGLSQYLELAPVSEERLK
jgi:hypothetical protein